MRVLVLGGTGAIGVSLVKILVSNGIETFVTSRQNNNSDKNLNYIRGNALDSIFIIPLLNQKWDVIIDFMVYSEDIFKQRIDLYLNATTQYVFLSSARVYGNSIIPITENTSRLLNISKDKDFIAANGYALVKAKQEDLLRNSEKSNWTIIRPYITYNDNRLQLGVLEKEEWLYRALKGRSIVFSKDIIEKVTSLTFGHDVSNGIYSIIGNNNVLGETYHIVNTESKKWEEVLSIYLNVIEQHLGYKPKVVLQDLNNFLMHHYDKHQVLYDRNYDREFNSEKFLSVTDHFCFKPMLEGLSICLEKFIQKPIFLNIDWKKEALKDKICGEKTPLKEIKDYKQKIKYLIFRYIK
jgi:nucleoside-diphosphate-sugar epimerase